MANDNGSDHSGAFSDTASQAASSPSTSGEHKEGKSQRRKSSPVISNNGSEGHPTRGQRSRTISVSMMSPSLNLHLLSINQQQLPMASRNTPKDTPEMYWHHEIDNILRAFDGRGWTMADGFAQAPEHPPITPNSLAELDMPRIINNPKLRHDVNFDRELHFRPNLDGSKGKQKIESAEMYWKALEGELVMCGFVQGRKYDGDYSEKEAYWQKVLTYSLRRLPSVFNAVRDILKTLVPDFDQQAITDRLDVALIMREISHGVCDLVDLANWLCKVLKSHCAPMRDDLVDRMREKIMRGATEQKPEKLVSGLRLLLMALEAMKLDVANHQIRHMRSILIDNSIDFSKRYNTHRVGQGKINVVHAKIWAEVAKQNFEISQGGEIEATLLDGICSGILKSMLFPDYAYHPTTFYLDVERLTALRVEMQTVIYHKICKGVLYDFYGHRVPPVELAKAQDALYLTVCAIVGSMGQFEANRENIAAEIMRIGLLLEGQPHITYDAVLLDRLEERLEIELQYGSAVYENHADRMIARLLPRLQAAVEQDVKLTAIQLQDKLVPPLTHHNPNTHAFAFGAALTPAMPTQSLDPEDDFLRRFTHIIALHWHVWVDICYLVPLEELEVTFCPDGEGRTPPPSPTVPVAQAVYAPGRKWLPVGITVTDVPSGPPSPALTNSPEPRPQSKKEQASEPQEEQGGKAALEEKKQPQQSA